MNLGAGRIVWQELVRLDNALETDAFLQNPHWQELVSYCTTQHKPLHLMGLVSAGGVHSQLSHLQHLLRLLAPTGIQVYIHAFTDGRDCGPTSGLGYIQQLEQTIAQMGCGKIVSLVGRYYAMDRDKRWERVQKAYDLLVKGHGTLAPTAAEALEEAYAEGQTDEFVHPFSIRRPGEPAITLQADDAVLFFNFRTDRGRQLTTALTQFHPELEERGLHSLNLRFFTLTQYDPTFTNVQPLVYPQAMDHPLGQVLSEAGLTQLRIAETEKYPHVTFFFNGGREEPFPGEERILIPSPKVATYDLQPEMSAPQVRDALLPRLREGKLDFICLNFANPDMVGHTGDMQAAIRAVETVDSCMASLTEAALQSGYHVIVLSDHGNCDRMRNPDGTPHTAHTLQPVNIMLFSPPGAPVPSLHDGVLGDVAPTVLQLMGLPQPPTMTGKSLLRVE